MKRAVVAIAALAIFLHVLSSRNRSARASGGSQYNDEPKKKQKSSPLTGILILCLFVGVIGLIIWMMYKMTARRPGESYNTYHRRMNHYDDTAFFASFFF